ncbi:NUDIX hydrolase [Clostridium sp. YIM B02505]|uniref:NUDIX hydrolase n=1 Tax=Clostridium yunnanense TaxID=2800325 RepID=A0ABS1EV88_9CLOT|nr:NUDIX hydrolase [Clostridium yunnanense]MBK1813215.1 NUDIX hydrolase [Clostridium yunnanense]
MGRLRAQAIVVEEDRILLVKTHLGNRYDYELPGGGIEEGETPEEAAIRELFEETGIKGEIVRLASKYYNGFSQEYNYSFLINRIDGEITQQYNAVNEKNYICAVEWKKLNEISEKNRAELFSAGVMFSGFCDEVVSWGAKISYPSEKDETVKY